MLEAYIILTAIAVIFIFIIYLIYDLATSNPNSFMDRWAKKTLWIWLPFYSLQRLIREVILKKK